jgi:hypothetical protein
VRGGALHSVGERVVGNLDTAGRARLGDADKRAPQVGSGLEVARSAIAQRRKRSLRPGL